MIEHDDLDAEVLGQFRRAEPLHLPAPRPGIADEDGVWRPRDDQGPPSFSLVEVAGDRTSAEADGAHGEDCRRDKSQNWAVPVRIGPDHCDHDQGPANAQSRNPKGLARRSFGDGPPRRR